MVLPQHIVAGKKVTKFGMEQPDSLYFSFIFSNRKLAPNFGKALRDSTANCII